MHATNPTAKYGTNGNVVSLSKLANLFFLINRQSRTALKATNKANNSPSIPKIGVVDAMILMSPPPNISFPFTRSSETVSASSTISVAIEKARGINIESMGLSFLKHTNAIRDIKNTMIKKIGNQFETSRFFLSWIAAKKTSSSEIIIAACSAVINIFTAKTSINWSGF